MKPGDRRYTVNMIRAGQEKPYADTIHEFTLKIEWVPYKKREQHEPMEWEPNDLHDQLVDRAAKTIGYNWVEKNEGDWASPHLTHRSKIGPGEWRFIITEIFTD